MNRNTEIENRIFQRFKNLKTINKRTLDTFLENNQEIKKYILSLKDYFKIYSLKEIIFFIRHQINIFEYTCKNCNKQLKYIKNRNMLCINCLNHSKEFIKKRKERQSQVLKEKYDEIKSKIENTCLKKYGVSHPWKSIEIQDKIKNTNLRKYGTQYSSQNEDIKQKQKNSIKLIDQNTRKQKYQKTIKEKYNANNVFDLYRNKNSELRKRNFWNTILSWNNYVIPLFTVKDLNHILDKTIYKWKCTKCGNEFESHIHKTMHVKEFPYLPRCLNCYPYLIGESTSEKELTDFCKQYFPELKENDSTLIKPYELDIVIPEIKLAIEFNGDFWHSLEYKIDLNYHLNKTNLCNEKGYRLIHIWENEWNQNKDYLKEKLIKVFKNNEQFFSNEEMIKLDKSWFNRIEIKNYILIEEIPPQIITRDKFRVPNCGYLIFKKQK